MYGIGSLAVFPHKNVMRKNLILDKYIDSIGRDDAELISAEERAGILAAKLELFAPGTRQFALVGDVGETELNALSDTLSKMIPDTEFLPNKYIINFFFLYILCFCLLLFFSLYLYIYFNLFIFKKLISSIYIIPIF